MSLDSALIVWKWVPETTGTTLEEMSKLWRKTGACAAAKTAIAGEPEDRAGQEGTGADRENRTGPGRQTHGRN